VRVISPDDGSHSHHSVADANGQARPGRADPCRQTSPSRPGPASRKDVGRSRVPAEGSPCARARPARHSRLDVRPLERVHRNASRRPSPVRSRAS
jgi:hypothetical protein